MTEERTCPRCGRRPPRHPGSAYGLCQLCADMEDAQIEDATAPAEPPVIEVVDEPGSPSLFRVMDRIRSMARLDALDALAERAWVALVPRWRPYSSYAGHRTAEQIAELAYEAAEALLAERDRRRGTQGGR